MKHLDLDVELIFQKLSIDFFKKSRANRSLQQRPTKLPNKWNETKKIIKTKTCEYQKRKFFAVIERLNSRGNMEIKKNCK